MLDGRPGGNIGNGRGAQVIRMKAMIRHENHGGVLAGFFEQRPQHLVVKLVSHRDHVVVQLEVALADPGLPRRMVSHEAVAEVIDRIEVDREEIPRLVIQQPNGGGLDAHAFGERPQEHGQPLVIVLIDLSGQRNKRLHHLRR